MRNAFLRSFIQRFLFVCLVLATFQSGALAALPFVHPVFTSDMVMQRDVPVPVWGWTTPGASVSVSMNGQTVVATAGSDGRWQATLSAQSAGGPHTLSITGPQSVTCTNVMVGDVWLCAGQSNMEMGVADAAAGTGVLNAATERADSNNYPNIRQLKVESAAGSGATARTPQLTLPATNQPWRVASSTTTGGFSAVGYFMSRTLYQEYAVPMGILNVSKGSCQHAPFLSLTVAAAIPDLSEDVYNLATVTIDDLATPCVRYNAMLAPLIGFPIRGIIWYQGESSVSLAHQYFDALPAMLNDWRTSFGNPNMPVVIVQVSTYAKSAAIPVKPFDTYPIMREAQLKTSQSLSNAGLVCTIDTGDSLATTAVDGSIHPWNKQDVGKRTARVMRQLAYGAAQEGQGPIFSGFAIEGSTIRCSFSHVGEGLMIGSKPGNSTDPVSENVGSALFGFALSSKTNPTADTDWKFATATIDPATNTVVVSNVAEVPTPKSVRYAWATNPHNYGAGTVCNLYSKITDGSGTVIDGLPASPFRSDSKVWLSVNSGTITGLANPSVTTFFAPASTKTITATAAPVGQEFVGWVGDTSALANPSLASTTATLSSSDPYTSVRATYRFITPPANFATAIYGTEAALSWDAVSGARYKVLRSVNGGAFETLVTDLTANTYTDATVVSGNSYQYKIVSLTLGAESPQSSPVVSSVFSLTAPTLAADRFTIPVQTVVGKNYRVEKSTDLIDWTVLQTGIVGTGGQVEIEDLFVTQPPKVFYRAVAY